MRFERALVGSTQFSSKSIANAGGYPRKPSWERLPIRKAFFAPNATTVLKNGGSQTIRV
jgi:hypothetical protein